ncbi:MAG: LTA synthase family protein [Desulfovibrio sp.]|nr:LTA synthase family protein [Desulfovibrio sp.]
MLFVLTPLFVMLACVFLHRFCTPKPARPFFLADTLASLAALFCYLFFLVLSQKIFLAAFLALALLGLLAAVNQAKRRALRDEALLFTDVALLSQVFRYPRLYLPFLPVKAILLASLLFIPFCFWLGRFSPKLSAVAFGLSLLGLLPFLALIIILSSQRFRPFLQAWVRALLKKAPLTLQSLDVNRYGPLGAAFLQLLWHLYLRGESLGICGDPLRPFAPLSFDAKVLCSLAEVRKPLLPHLILIQAESFCDPRPFLREGQKKEELFKRLSGLLPNFDRLALQGRCGQLKVQAFGAYTMRTEYEVLTGIAPRFLGTDALHPYISAARTPSWSIAQFLAELGYATVCVHPFARGFFYREDALPKLGFKNFLALDNFYKPEFFGPYVSDESLGQVLLELLRQSTRPVFVFGITMENHGPWQATRFGPELSLKHSLDTPDLFLGEQIKVLDLVKELQELGISAEVARYLVHVRNGDRFLAGLDRELSKLSRPTLVASYGDHLPNLNALVPRWALTTPYLIFAAGAKLKPWPLGQDNKLALNLTPSELTGEFLNCAFYLSKMKL